MTPSGTSPLIDPRLRNRRIEVARDHGRRRLRILVAAVAVLVVVGLGVALTQSPVLDVDDVRVQGTSSSDADEVREVADIASGTPMVVVDLDGAAARVEALPWVAEASVRRSWPGTVTISVAERTPVAIVGSGSPAMLVDAQGRVLGPAGDAEELVRVSGPTAAAGESLDDARVALLGVLAELPDELRVEVAEASVTDAQVTLILADDIEVQWGTDARSTAKADALVVLLDQANRDTVATINVSVPRATTLTRKTGGA